MHKATSRTKRKSKRPATDPISQLSGQRELRGVSTRCSCIPSTGAEQMWKDLRGTLKPILKLCKASSRAFSLHSHWWILKASRNTWLYLTYFYSPVKPVTSPLPLSELWIYQEHTSVATLYWDHPSAAENAFMHSVNIRRSGVTCFYQLTESTSIQPKCKVILRYCVIHWQGTAQERTKAAEGASFQPCSDFRSHHIP